MSVLSTAWPWILVGLVSLGWWGFFGFEALKRTVGRIGGYWFLIGLIVLVDLIAAGRLGADMGLPALFRDDPFPDAPYRNSFNSRAVWGAFTATYLVGLVWTIIYLLLFIDPANFKTLPATCPPPGPPPRWRSRHGWAVPCQDNTLFRNPLAVLKYLIAVTPPFLILLLAIGAFPADVIDVTGEVWTKQRYDRARFEFFEYLVGTAIGVVAIWLLVWLSWLIMRPARGLRRWLKVPTMRNWVWPNDPEEPIQEDAASGAWAFIAINIVLFIIPLVLSPKMVPSFGIGMLLCFAALGYFVIMGAPRPFRAPLVILIGLYVGWSNGDPYKYRFPGIDRIDKSSYYDPANLDTSKSNPGDPHPPLLKDGDVLDEWKKKLKDDRPKLVLLAVSGGGYRASFWTATVIDELEDRSGPTGTLKGLADRIRLITGASGGMVGASHYVALRAGGMLKFDVRPPVGVVAKLREATKLDSLTPVVQRLVQRDIPLIFWRFPNSYQKEDRGTVFEDEWKLLGQTTFSSLRAREADGSIPSLIVSPMIIETGERLLISNLDVDAIAAPKAVSGVEYEPSGRVFFRRFPEAHGTFLLKTAARMSASFPYVLPAVSLPTVPTARIVDAGYYDNFGVNLAAAWAYENRAWIRKNTSGLAMIQVNAFPRELSSVAASQSGAVVVGPDPAPAPKTAGDALAERVGGAFQWLTSPVEGGASARDWSMFFRNKEQLRLLDDTFNTDKTTNDAGRRFFEGFVFTNDGEAAMNVIIGDEDILRMRQAFEPPKAFEPPTPNPSGEADPRDAKKFKNYETMLHLIDWWNDRPLSVESKNTVPLVTPAQTNPGP